MFRYFRKLWGTNTLDAQFISIPIEPQRPDVEMADPDGPEEADSAQPNDTAVAQSSKRAREHSPPTVEKASSKRHRLFHPDKVGESRKTTSTPREAAGMFLV